MRLTALCVCGTLLAFSSLSWTTVDSDEADLLGDNGFGPCGATLIPEGPCRQRQDDSTCPYLFSLPPLTVHLPKQLGELEKIMRDLQNLKDNVDQLRKICADCKVSQTEKECGRQREREHDTLNEGRDGRKDENCLKERNPDRLKDFSREHGTDRVKAEKKMEGDGDTDSEKSTTLEEKGRNKWEAERESDKGVVKENENEETLKEVAEKPGKTQMEGAKGKDKLAQAKVPAAGGYEGRVDMDRKKERETDKNKGKDSKGNSRGDREDMLGNGKEKMITSNIKNKEKTEESDHHVWRDETKETDRKTQTEEDRGNDGIKMSEDHDEHINKEREQHGEERKKEMEKGIKVERNNEGPKQTESIGRAEKETTIKEGEVEEKDRETGKEIKTEGEKRVQSVQRDSDGELASSKATERADFVSISPTPHSTISLALRRDSMDSNEAVTFASSLPSSPLSSSTSHLITGVNQEMTTTAHRLQAQRTGLESAGISEHPSSRPEAGFRTTSRPTTAATINSLGGPGQKITSTTTRSTSPTSAGSGAGLQGRVSSAMATTTTTTPRQDFDTTTFAGVTDRSRWTAKRNISSNTKALPGRGPKAGEKQKPAIKPEADRKLKNPKNDRKSDRAPLPDKKTKHDQKQKPSHQKPTTDQKFKPGKDPKPVQIPKRDQRPPPDTLPTDPNLKKTQIPKYDQEHTTDQNQLPNQKPKSHQKSLLPAQRPTSHQRPQTGNTTGSDKDPLIEQEPETVEDPIINQNSKPERKLVYPLKTDKPDQNQKPPKKTKSEEKTNLDQSSTLNQYPTPVQEPEPERSETTSLTPKPNQKPVTEFMESADKNPFIEPKSVQDSSHGQKIIPDRDLIKPPDQKPKPNQIIPELNQEPKPSPIIPQLNQDPKPSQIIPELNQEPKPSQIIPELNQEPKPSQIIPQLNQKPKPSQMIPQLNQEPKPSQIIPQLNQEPKPSHNVPQLNQEPKPSQIIPQLNQKPKPSQIIPQLNQKPKPSQIIPQLNQKPKPSQIIPQLNQKPKPDQTPKPNQKHPHFGTGQKTKPKVKPKPEQTPQTNQGLKTPRNDHMSKTNPKSVPEEIPVAESDKTSTSMPLPRHRPPNRPTVKPGATSVQRPKPSVQLEPSPKTRTDLHPPQVSKTTSDSIQNSQTDMPPASGPVKQTADVTHSPGDTEFSPSKMKTITLGPKTSSDLETGPFPRLHFLAEGFTVSPNSRITSDLRPQTASQQPSIPMTTRPNKIMRGILPGVIPSTRPGSTKPKQVSNTDSRLPAKILHKVEETAPRQTPDPDEMMIPVPSPSAQTTSTTSPDLRSTARPTWGPEPLAAEASTPSARELRVKINQVAAFFNNSLSPNGRPPDRRPVEYPEDNQGGSKVPMMTSSKDTTARRDCSDHLLRGETRSGVYVVTPDLRSRSFPVFCDMELDGGGWTLLQRRQDGSVSFNRTWADYRSGFGKLDGGEFWLGNNMIHLLTRDRDMALRVELEDFDGVMEYAEYQQFRVASERMRYRLTVGGYSGTAGDALRFSKSYDHNNRAFTTPDRDHDRYPSGNCGAYYSSGWWFDACMAANPNGRYYVGRYKGVRDGIFWGTWHNISSEYYPTNDRQSFKTVRMLIRPKGFTP